VEIKRKLIPLAIAVIDSYTTQYGTAPTPNEYLAGMTVAWSGKKLSDVAY